MKLCWNRFIKKKNTKNYALLYPNIGIKNIKVLVNKLIFNQFQQIIWLFFSGIPYNVCIYRKKKIMETAVL